MTTAMTETSVLPLDTHAAFIRLVGAGASEDMAQAIVDMHVGILSTGLATKADINELRTATKGEIKQLRTEMQAQFDAVNGKFDAVDGKFDQLRTEVSRDITSAKLTLVMWFVGGNVAVLSLMIAIFKGLI